MKSNHSLEFIYENCANRIKERKNKLNITSLEIYPCDDKMISKITNNKRTKNNRFLITDRVLEYYSKDNKEIYGIVSKLNFNSKSEVLWGNKKEIQEYLYKLFFMIFDDLLESSDKNKLEPFFLDYVPYAKYTALYKILFRDEVAKKELKQFSFLLAYGLSEDEVINEYLNFLTDKKEIINYLYKKYDKDFYEIFLSFANQVQSFHKIDKIFSDFIEEKFIQMLKTKRDERTSLGIRVYNIILEDISMTEKLLSNKNYDDYTSKITRNRIRVSSRYIVELEKLQKNEINMLKTKSM